MATVSGMVNAGNYTFNNYSASNARNSINSLWSNYGSFSSNAANTLSGLNEIRTNSAAVVESYNTAKDTFYTEFDSTMSALSKSSANVQSLNLSNTDFGEDAITTTEETDKDGKTTTKTTYSKPLQNALDTIKSFVSDYNDSISFLKDNSEVSGRVSRLATEFGDTTYRAANYESIGISVKSDGTLKIDEEALAQAIVDDPSKVESILGKDGLAGKADSHVDTANSQRDNLFPSAKSMLGKQLDTAALYTGSAFINMTMISNIGNLVNMMF